MADITFVGKVFAYGTPPFMILLGFSAYTSGKLAESIFGTSEGLTVIGGLLMTVGIVLSIAEVYLKFR